MFDMILDLVMKHTPLEAWEVNTDSRLREDLQMDQSDLFRMQYDLGNLLDAEITDEDMAGIITVMDLLKLTEKYAKQ